MTSYSTTSQLKTAAGGDVGYVQVFDWNTDGSADDDKIAELQEQVDRWIDSFCGTRYAVPMESPNAALTQLAAEEVVFRARRDRNMTTQDHRDDHKARTEWLQDVARGKAVPCDPQPAKAASVRSAWVDRNADDVSRENLKGTVW